MEEFYPEARIALCKCGTTQKIRGVRFQKKNDGWEYTWTFPIKEGSAKRENYDSTVLKGNLYLGDEYPGCPDCGAKAFLVCGGCGKLNCNQGNGKCHWCGMDGDISDYDGSGVKTDIDR